MKIQDFFDTAIPSFVSKKHFGADYLDQRFVPEFEDLGLRWRITVTESVCGRISSIEYQSRCERILNELYVFYARAFDIMNPGKVTIRLKDFRFVMSRELAQKSNIEKSYQLLHSPGNDSDVQFVKCFSQMLYDATHLEFYIELKEAIVDEQSARSAADKILNRQTSILTLLESKC